MVSSNAIDEQRVARFSRLVNQTHLPVQQASDNKPPVTSPSAPASAPVARETDGSDSDRDPNDFVPNASGSRPTTTVGRDPYASGSDDEDYF